MNLHELPLEHPLLADRNVAIKLVGVGGAGANAVDRLKMENLERLQLAVINTDYQALASSPVQDKVLIGMSITRGLGAGGDPELGREAAEADRDAARPAERAAERPLAIDLERDIERRRWVLAIYIYISQKKISERQFIKLFLNNLQSI